METYLDEITAVFTLHCLCFYVRFLKDKTVDIQNDVFGHFYGCQMLVEHVNVMRTRGVLCVLLSTELQKHILQLFEGTDSDVMSFKWKHPLNIALHHAWYEEKV